MFTKDKRKSFENASELFVMHTKVLLETTYEYWIPVVIIVVDNRRNGHCQT